MGRLARYCQRGFRGIAVLGSIAAMGGFLALVAAGLEAASRQGVQVYVDLPLTMKEAETLFVAGGVALVGGVVVNIFGNTVASFAAGFRSGTQTPSESAASGEAAGVPVSERYRRRLETLYLANGGLVASIVVLGILGPESFGVVGRFAELIVLVLFGSIGGGILVAVLLGGLWYGVKQRATEALVGGFFVGILFFLSAITVRSAGFAIFAFLLVYYSLLARGATRFQFVESTDVPAGIGQRFE